MMNFGKRASAAKGGKMALFVRTILIAAIGLLSAGTQVSADMWIRADPGGEVGSALATFLQARQTGERVIIDGPCLSACTLVLSVVPRDRICVTHRAVLGFHAARELDNRTGRLSPATEATRLIVSTYPASIQHWIARHGGLSRRLILLRGRELTALYPACSGWSRPDGE
jgi:hypothetical protein